jgi:hypothetical protein
LVSRLANNGTGATQGATCLTAGRAPV